MQVIGRGYPAVLEQPPSLSLVVYRCNMRYFSDAIGKS